MSQKPTSPRAPCLAVGCGSVTSHFSGRCSGHRTRAGALFATDDFRVLTAPVKPKSHEYRDLGKAVEFYRIACHTHRVGGPASITTHLGGIREESWFFRGKPHRVDGPAYETLDAAGNSYGGLYVLGGVAVLGGWDELVTKLGTYAPERLRAEFSFSSFAVLLDEGSDPTVVLDVLRAGVRTIDGVREVLHRGAPAEWVATFERAS